MLNEKIAGMLKVKEGKGHYWIKVGITSVHDVVKLYLLDRIKEGELFYRRHKLDINDEDGFTDAITLKADLTKQIEAIDEFEAIKDAKVNEELEKILL